MHADQELPYLEGDGIEAELGQPQGVRMQSTGLSSG